MQCDAPPPLLSTLLLLPPWPPPLTQPSHTRQVVCPYRSIEERAMPLKQMGDLGQV
jgi:hypothetical protein